AAAVACEPSLLILDEPTTALDVTVEAQLLDLLEDLRERRRLSVLYISHSLAVVRRLCDRVCVLYAGQLVERGPSRPLFRAPAPPTKGAPCPAAPRPAGPGPPPAPSRSPPASPIPPIPRWAAASSAVAPSAGIGVRTSRRWRWRSTTSAPLAAGGCRTWKGCG